MKKTLDTRFPAARIKKIMQADKDIGKMALDVPPLVSKALELFLQDLCDQTYGITLKRAAKTMNSLHLKQCVETFNVFDFLREIVSKVPDLGGSDTAGDERSVAKRRKVDGEDTDDDEAKRSRMSVIQMDSKLLKAAREGDVVALDSLLEEDPLILEKVALSPTAETPLHIASLAGKTVFVKKILSLKPSFAWELNPSGFSPLHIASANGYIEVVKELLKLGPQLCLIKDKAGRNPLHFAAMKGRVHVIAELVSCCPNCVKEVTTKGETPLHLAVKNKQFEAVKMLLEKVKEDDENDNGELINAKDNEGNTIFQLAMATEQLQVIELLRNESKVEQDMDIKEVGSASGHQFDDGAEAKTQETQTASSDSKQNIWEEVQEMVLVVASLIATVTYQAGLSPPSTIWKQDMKLDSKCIFHHHYHPLSYSCPDLSYFLFMSFNTAGFFASIFLIFFFRSPSSVQVLLPIALISMMITYVTLSVKMSPSGLTLLIIYLATIAIFVYCVLAVEFVKKILHSMFGFAAEKVRGMAKALVKKRKPASASADALKLDA
ncbi:ankyrin repeat-containing protein BDA1-like isoform X2 [Pistacia vera]|uniref:ankyrin repeat-containing protein BDA1-like isoform X2 n=1 Tax=Pistacia vera TaxID=55513 RepID=UPI001263463C|nr:ankyrin repeat-containing protein BDA1-like isoform X2 [Pistacia vera]